MAQGSPLRTRALRLLARREHSRAELERKLREHAADPAELAALLDDLERRGWLSEARLAEQHLAKARGRYGPRRVLGDLKGKGVSREALAAAAAQLKQSELADAIQVWRKRFGAPPANLKEKAHQARFLAARGFSAEVIRAVVRGELEDEA